MKECRKCLLKELNKEDYFKNVYEYIESIPEDIKTGNDEYKKRLEICQGCEKLENGICRVCGCFVEVRASINSNYCPDSKRYW